MSALSDVLGVEATDLPDELWIHNVDVERGGALGRDASGNAVTGWTIIYRGLRCCIESLSAREKVEHRQAGLDISHTMFVPPLSNGALPDIRGRDRILFGKRKTDGKPRYLGVEDDHDVMEAGLLLVVVLKERIPGG